MRSGFRLKRSRFRMDRHTRASRSMVSSSGFQARAAALKAPELHPTTPSGRIPASSRARSTPTVQAPGAGSNSASTQATGLEREPLRPLNMVPENRCHRRCTQGLIPPYFGGPALPAIMLVLEYHLLTYALPLSRANPPQAGDLPQGLSG